MKNGPVRAISFDTILLILLLLLQLSSCAPIYLASATTGGVVATSERTSGAFLEDAVIEFKGERLLEEKIGDRARFSLISFNRVLLVTGQAPSQSVIDEITELTSGIENVRRVINKIAIGGQLGLTAISADAVLTAKTKSRLLGVQEGEFNSIDIKVVTENNVVYLMGLVSRANAAIAVDVARNTSGVLKVVRIFEYRD